MVPTKFLQRQFCHAHLVVLRLSFQKRPQSSKSDQHSQSYGGSRESCSTWTFWSILNGCGVLFASFLVSWTRLGHQIWTAHVQWCCWHIPTPKNTQSLHWPARDMANEVVLHKVGHTSATMGLLCKILADYQCWDQDAACDTFG